jgi:hypothetical protein
LLPTFIQRERDSGFATQIGDGHPGLVLLQNADDLVFDEPAALHLWSSRLGQSRYQNGLGAGGNVTKVWNRITQTQFYSHWIEFDAKSDLKYISKISIPLYGGQGQF